MTAVVISGRALGAITQACGVARSLQPAMVIVEDVDLIAEERTARPGEHPLLFQLLNEMEGLTSASDVIFLLTTNRADLATTRLSPSAQGGWTWPPSCPFPTLTRVAR